MSGADGESPVSFRVNISRLQRTGLPVWLEADDEQRAALAEAHGLLDVERFRVDAVVAPWQGSGIKVTGRIEAAISQACIVSLEPVPATIEEDFEALLVPEGSRLMRPQALDRGEIQIDAEGPDMPETFSGDHVDVGALAEEFFELAIDPYPRAPGASLPAAPAGNDDGAERPNPFRDKLAKLARKS
ncbi:MAG: DUF177 domain-containing protein [Rhizobiaceae bacterium]|nr:DUF177 domain-containing protein [Rhizobiaceae bacterium]